MPRAEAETVFKRMKCYKRVVPDRAAVERFDHNCVTAYRTGRGYSLLEKNISGTLYSRT